MLKRSLLALMAALLLLPAARADELELKGGKTVKGVIVSESSRFVTVMVLRGRKISKMRIPAANVISTIEGAEIGIEEIDAKIAEIDGDDPDEVMQVAEWAKGKGITGHELLAHVAIRLDEDHEAAHKMLGHHFAIDKWFEKEKDARKYFDKKMGAQMKEEGFVKYKGGWIKKEDKSRMSRDKDSFMKDERGIWRDKAEIMHERGYTLVNGRWLKLTEDDRKDAEAFKRLVGEDIIPITTKHFRIFVMQYPPEKVEELAQKAEEAYSWWLKVIGKPEDFPLFRGQQGHIWVMKDFTSVQEWYKHYKARYGVASDDFGSMLQRSKGRILSSGRLLGLTNIENIERDPVNEIINYAAQFCATYYTPGLCGRSGGPARGAWFAHAVGNEAERVITGNGFVVFTTKTEYGGQGGIANKKFDTESAKEVIVRMIRDGFDPFDQLDKKGLNSLDGRDLARGWSIVNWLIENHNDKFVQWMDLANTADVASALRKAFQWSTEDLDNAWEKKLGR